MHQTVDGWLIVHRGRVKHVKAKTKSEAVRAYVRSRGAVEVKVDRRKHKAQPIEYNYEVRKDGRKR